MGQGQYSLSDIQPESHGQGQYSLADVADVTSVVPQPSPSYLGEALAGVGRTVKGALSMIPQMWEYNKNLPGGIAQGVAQDLWKGITQSGQASQKAKESGEGIAGQILAGAENYPVISGMVRKAEEAGPGYIKFKPQTLGATAEALSTFEGPQLVGKAGKLANRVIPARLRAGAGINLLKAAFGDKPPVGNMDSYALARNLIDKWGRQGKPIPNELKTFIDNVETADMASRHPEIAQQMAARGQAVKPYSFNDLHEAKEALNDLKYNKSIAYKQAQQIGQVAKLAGDELQRAADTYGFGDDWRQTQTEYQRASQLVRGAEKAGPYVGAIAGGLGAKILAPDLSALGVPQAMQFGPAVAELGSAALGMKAGKTALGKVARTIVDRSSAGPPRLRALPATSPAYTRVLLDAKEGLIPPGEADRRIVKMGGKVKVTPIPQVPAD